MQITENQYDLIQKFMRDELSESEQKQFDMDLKNETFRNELHEQAEILRAVESVHDNKLKAIFKEADAEMAPESGAKIVEMPKPSVKESTVTRSIGTESKKSSFGFLKYAAVAALLLISVFVFKQFSGGVDSSIDNNTLYAQYHQTYDANVLRGQTQDSKSFSDALFSYSSEDYTKAESEFATLADVSEEALFFRSLSQLELGKFDLSIAGFKKVAAENSKYAQEAEWYEAMAYLKTNDLQKLKSKLNQITTNASHDYNSKAEALLKELK